MKRVFRYCATHKEAESYLKEMCAQGWAATGVFEGLWTFEPCKPGEFTYRCASLRGKTVEQIEEKLRGNTCGRRPTSCADQLAKAVRQGYEEEKKGA